MFDPTLLLAPVAILGVVLLLGFVGCSGNWWSGSGTPEPKLTLEAKAPQPGPGVIGIENATFRVAGPGGLSDVIQATKIDAQLWQAERTFQQPPLGQWMIAPEVVFNSDDPIQGQVLGANLTAEFEKDWSAGATMVWSFCVNYHPENEGIGSLYALEEC